MSVPPTKEWAAALKRLQAIECACGGELHWQITHSITAQFTINEDGVTEGDHYIGDDPVWSMICGECGDELEIGDSARIQNDLLTVAWDLS